MHGALLANKNRPEWRKGDWIMWDSSVPGNCPTLEERFPFVATCDPEERPSGWFYRDQPAFNFRKPTVRECISLINVLNSEMQSVITCVTDLRKKGAPPHLKVS